jgi:hypothetical protein
MFRPLLSFETAFSPEMNAVEVVPSVDGRPLVELIAAFEVRQGWAPAGGYGGLFPGVFRLGPAVAYWLGTHPGGSRVIALGCECGELACWPLAVEVMTTAETVAWQNFEQPNRPERDYSGFGPFVFDREQYENAVATVEALFEESA